MLKSLFGATVYIKEISSASLMLAPCSPTPSQATLLAPYILLTMLIVTRRRPSIRTPSWLAPALTKAGSSRIAHRTFYSDLYENEGHLFDLHRDEGRPTLTPTSFNNNARPNTQQGHRFSTSHRSAYEVERQMQRVSRAISLPEHVSRE